MSYILDALKKSQSEQALDGVSLRMTTQAPKRKIQRWLSVGFGIVLACNAGLLLWIFVLDDQDQTTFVASTPPAPTAQIDPAPAKPQAVRVQPELPTPAPIKAKPQPVALVAKIVKLKLIDLSVSEQSLYNGFTYSTHIYTDDPTLCAIVVDGQRLMAGDRFQGLVVVAITEAGVIFEQLYNGQRRQVEVSVLEQWAD